MEVLDKRVDSRVVLYFPPMVLVSCPRCNIQFQSINRLARHLASRRRRFRCGMYVGEVNFICDCGRRYTRIRTLKAHLESHRRNIIRSGREHLSTARSIRRTSQCIGFYNEDDDYENLEIIEGEVEGGERGGDYMNLSARTLPFAPADSLLPAGQDLSVNNVTLVPGISYSAFQEAVNHDMKLKALAQLYRYCLSACCTTRAYRELAGLDVIDPSCQVPKRRKDLRKFVMTSVASTSGWVTMQKFSLPVYKRIHVSPTPYITVHDALRIWLSLPVILLAVRDSMMNHLPENLLDENAYNDLIAKRSQAVHNGVHVYQSVADGSEYLPSVRACMDNFADAYSKALQDDIEVLVCTVGFYEDGYRKQKDSLVNQQMLCLILCR